MTREKYEAQEKTHAKGESHKAKCDICKKESCNGKKFIVPYRYDYYRICEGVKMVCESQTEMRGECRIYKVVFAHGVTPRFKVYPAPEPIEIL